MDNIYLIGAAAIVLWIASFWFYFRSSNEQSKLHNEIESLNRALDAGDKE